MILLAAALAAEVETPPPGALDYQLTLHAPRIAQRLNPHLAPPTDVSDEFALGYAEGIVDAQDRPLAGAAVGGAATGCLAGSTCFVGVWAPCLAWPVAFAGAEWAAVNTPTTVVGAGDPPPDWVLGWQAGYHAELTRRRTRVVAVGSLVGLGVAGAGYGVAVGAGRMAGD